MKKPKTDYLDYRTRSYAMVRDMNLEPVFIMLCYGMSHSELATVGGPDGGGQQLRRRLEARGLDKGQLNVSVFDTGPVNDTFTGQGTSRVRKR